MVTRRHSREKSSLGSVSGSPHDTPALLTMEDGLTGRVPKTAVSEVPAALGAEEVRFHVLHLSSDLLAACLSVSCEPH